MCAPWMMMMAAAAADGRANFILISINLIWWLIIRQPVNVRVDFVLSIIAYLENKPNHHQCLTIRFVCDYLKNCKEKWWEILIYVIYLWLFTVPVKFSSTLFIRDGSCSFFSSEMKRTCFWEEEIGKKMLMFVDDNMYN